MESQGKLTNKRLTFNKTVKMHKCRGVILGIISIDNLCEKCIMLNMERVPLLRDLEHTIKIIKKRRNIMKKRILAALLSASLILSLVGCGTADVAQEENSAQQDSEQVVQEIVIEFGIHVANPEEQEAVTYQIVEEFNAQFDGQYQVEFIAADTETHSRNMTLAAQDGTLPEIFWLNSAEASEYVQAELLLDLTSFLAEYGTVSSGFDTSSLDAFNSGIQYGLPYQSNVEGFFYNKAIFRELGIDEPTNGTTFEELLEIVAVCEENGIVTIAQGFMNSGFATWGYYAMMDRYGYSDTINEVLNGEITFADTGLVDFFTSLEQLGQAGAFSENMSTQEYFDAKEMFLAGEAAFFNTGAWDAGDVTSALGEDVGFWWGPTFSNSDYDQDRAMKVPSAPIVVNADVATDAKVQEAVYKFLEFYYSEEMAALTYANSFFPATNYTGIEVSEDMTGMVAILESLDAGWVSPSAQPDQILSSSVQAQLYDSILGVLIGTYTPEEAVEKIDEQMQY